MGLWYDRGVKTTIEISDALLEEAKQLAKAKNLTLRELVECGLRGELKRRSAAPPFHLRDASVSGEGLTDSAERLTWTEILEMSYES